MYDEITNIKELAVRMNEEATKYGRMESDLLAVNGAGIELQWKTVTEKADFPASVHGMIWLDRETERLDGTMAKGIFHLAAFWFNEEGNRVKRPAEKLDRLAEEQNNV